jgi:hypothetical protein
MLHKVMGELVRGQLSSVRISAANQELFREYGLRRTEQAEFTKADHRAFTAEAFQFADSEGGHAAYLWFRRRELRLLRSGAGPTIRVAFGGKRMLRLLGR